MATRYPNNNQNRRSNSERSNAARRSSAQGVSRRPSSSNEAARRRAAQAARERQRQKQRRIRLIAIIVAILLIIAIVIVIAVACSHKKAPKGSGNTQPPSTTAAADVNKKSQIPTEYVAATVTHDDIAITDDDPIQGTDGSYTVRVNTALNVTTLYDGDGNAVRAFACSTGRRDGHETPEGTFSMGEWIIAPANEWCYMADGTEGLYAYRIIDGVYNDIMFHSVPYYETDHGTLETEEYNKLGDYASMGCIRMCCGDVRWLGEHLATGAEVVIYYDENEQLPLEKPTPYKIPADIPEISGWDPTDPVSSNPWHSYTIDLQVPNSVTVALNADYEQDPVIAAATAKDNYGNDVSQYLTVSGTWDNTKKGVYTVRLSCDIGPSHAYKDVYVVVE